MSNRQRLLLAGLVLLVVIGLLVRFDADCATTGATFVLLGLGLEFGALVWVLEGVGVRRDCSPSHPRVPS